MVQIIKKVLIAAGMLYSLNNDLATAQIKNVESPKKFEQISSTDSTIKEEFHYALELLDLEKQAGFNVRSSDYKTLDSIVNGLGRYVLFGGADEKYKRMQAINNLKNIDLTLKKNNFRYKDNPGFLFSDALKTKNLNSFHFLVLYLEVASKKNFQIIPMKIGEHFFAKYALDSLNFINWETLFGIEKSESLYKKLAKNKEIKPLSRDEFLSRGYRAIGFSLNKNKQFKESIEYLNKAIEIDSLDPIAYKFLGDSYNALGDDNNSLENYSMAISLNESFLDAYKARAEIFYKKKNFQKAFEDYDKAIKLSSENPEFYKNRGDVYSLLHQKTENIWKEKKEPKQTREDYEKALELIFRK